MIAPASGVADVPLPSVIATVYEPATVAVVDAYEAVAHVALFSLADVNVRPGALELIVTVLPLFAKPEPDTYIVPDPPVPMTIGL